MERMEYNPPVFKRPHPSSTTPHHHQADTHSAGLRQQEPRATPTSSSDSYPAPAVYPPMPPSHPRPPQHYQYDTGGADTPSSKSDEYRYEPDLHPLTSAIAEGSRSNNGNDHQYPAPNGLTADGPDPAPSRSAGNKRKHNEHRQPGNDLGDGSGDADGKAKKTRQSQSCDACRARKVKCDRPPPGSVTSQVPHRDICSHCEHLGLTCTFDYKPKKRGPPNMYMRRLQGENQSRASQSVSPPRAQPPVPPISLQHPSEDRLDAVAGATIDPSYSHRSTSTGEWEPTLATAMSGNRREGLSTNVTPTSRYAALASVYLDPRSANSSPSGQSRYSSQTQNLSPTDNSPTYTYSQHPQSNNNGLYRTPQEYRAEYRSPYTSPRYSKPVYMFVEHAHNPSNPFDAIMPRQTLYQILDHFFDYLYCLIPCLHRPSFTHDINMKREERPGEEEWTSLVLIIVASTLVQLPRSFVSMSRKEARQLISVCYEKVRAHLNQDFQDLTITRCITLYHGMFVSRMTGHMMTGRSELGSVNAFVLHLRANEEKSYSQLNSLDSILQRRLFWLLYGADKSVAAVEGTPVFLHEDDCADVEYPEEIDDEFITEQGVLPQPEGYTPILSGFAYISKLFRITGQVMDKHRRDKRRPPHGLLLQMRLNEINELYERTMTLMNDCPAPLRLEYRTGTRSVQSLSPGWNAKAKQDIVAVFTGHNPDCEIVKDCFLVQQANIYVTQQHVRLMILQYRDELHELQETDNLQQAGNRGSVPPQQQSSVRDPSGDGELTSSHEKDEVIMDLLAILQKIPMKVLAVNSFPIVAKVRYIASILLDSIDNPLHATGVSSHMVPSVLESKAQRAQRNLWQFLNILSEIEGLYSLDDGPTNDAHPVAG